MKHKSLDFNSSIDTTYVDLTLTLGDLKVLHNACVDIVNRHPEMIGYQRIGQKLSMVIDDYVFHAEHELPF
jgi:hypothetical protein